MSARKKSNEHAHDHGHDHGSDEVVEKNPEEQIAIARDLAKELGEIFVQYIQGQLDFAEVSFATYDVLQDLHIVSTGHYELVDEDDEDEDGDGDDWDDEDEYDEADATREQEDLSGEPAR